jgi:hypothetical protein
MGFRCSGILEKPVRLLYSRRPVLNGRDRSFILKLPTRITMIYQKQAEKGKQCQDCQGFIVKADKPAEGICNGNDVLAEGGCMFFKPKEEQQ